MRVANKGCDSCIGSKRDIYAFEYSPPEIKAAITSDGRSDETQMIKSSFFSIKMEARGNAEMMNMTLLPRR